MVITLTGVIFGPSGLSWRKTPDQRSTIVLFFYCFKPGKQAQDYLPAVGDPREMDDTKKRLNPLPCNGFSLFLHGFALNLCVPG